MSEKQTYNTGYNIGRNTKTEKFGPETPTHIEIKEYRWMRTKVALASAAIAAAAGTIFGMNIHNGESHPMTEDTPATTAEAVAPQAPRFEKITVKSGDSEWSIAERVNGHADTRDTIAALEKANPGLSPDSVYAGDTYSVPVDISDHDFKK